MLNRLSANALVKSVIAVLAAAVVVMLVGNAWSSWQRLVVANRISAVADLSGTVFTALNNLRFDRSFTFRSLAGPGPVADPLKTDLQNYRAKDLPALQAAAEKLAKLELADRSRLLSGLTQAASGLNLRGDMQAAANLMNSYLDGADAALNAGDVAQAKSFLEKAEPQVQKLEKFLNR